MRRCFAGGILGEVQVLAPCCCEGNNLDTHGEVGVGRDLNDGTGRDISTSGCWSLCLALCLLWSWKLFVCSPSCNPCGLTSHSAP